MHRYRSHSKKLQGGDHALHCTTKLTFGGEYMRPAFRVLAKGLMGAGGATDGCCSCNDSASLRSSSSCFNLSISCNSSTAPSNTTSKGEVTAQRCYIAGHCCMPKCKLEFNLWLWITVLQQMPFDAVKSIQRTCCNVELDTTHSIEQKL